MNIANNSNLTYKRHNQIQEVTTRHGGIFSSLFWIFFINNDSRCPRIEWKFFHFSIMSARRAATTNSWLARQLAQLMFMFSLGTLTLLLRASFLEVLTLYMSRYVWEPQMITLTLKPHPKTLLQNTTTHLFNFDQFWDVLDVSLPIFSKLLKISFSYVFTLYMSRYAQ